MADVFISYASADRDAAKSLAEELQSRGVSVWWDREIPPGRQYDQVIEEALDAARCVVLLWSHSAAASAWVKNEGAEALKREILVPALLATDVRIPLEFRRVQAADLTSWTAGNTSPEFERFFSAVRQVISRDPAPPKPPDQPPVFVVTSKRKPTWVWGAGGAVAVAALWGGYSVMNQPNPTAETLRVDAAVDAVADAAKAAAALAPGPAPTPTPTPRPQPAPASGTVDMPLQWRDYALNYKGRLQWDGKSPSARLNLRALDTGNGRLVAEGTFNPMIIMDAPGRSVLSFQVPLPNGDSRTAGAHTHAVNLVFEQQAGGASLFKRNCMAPGRPDLCFE